MARRGNTFESVQITKPRRAEHNMSFENKLSLNFGDLVPVIVQDVIPGDTAIEQSQVYMKLAPMTASVMHRCNTFIHYFFVPDRLVFEDSYDFLTGGEKGDYQGIPPQIAFRDADPLLSTNKLMANGSLADYLGFPTILSNVNTFGIDARPFRAYQLIYNEYYRDQNLSPKVEFNTGSTVASNERIRLMTMRRRCWEKDYFTSALPFAQRGEPVPVDITGTANQIRLADNGRAGRFVLASNGDDIPLAPTSASVPSNYTYRNWNVEAGANGTVLAGKTVVAFQGDSATEGKLLAAGAGYDPRAMAYDPNGSLIADSSGTFTINQLREAMAFQRWLEMSARVGSRYNEAILGHFGVRTPDLRINRPMYLGGGRIPLQFGEVLTTADTNEAPAGNPAGTGYVVGNSPSFRHTFTEHGWILGIMSVMPRTAYQQGLPRMYQRRSREDYFWPLYAHLGEQEIMESEIYATPENIESRKGFGYSARYAEYKYRPSEVHGEFRDSLAFWHMGRIFDSEPSLNASFVEYDPAVDDRIWAVERDATKPQTLEHLYAQVYHNFKMIRPVPKWSTPWF